MGGGYGNTTGPYIQRSHLHNGTAWYDATQNTGLIMRPASRIWQQGTGTAPLTLNPAPITRTGTWRIADAIGATNRHKYRKRHGSQEPFVGLPADAHHQLSWKRDRVLFTEKLRRIMSQVKEATWTILVDIAAIDGTKKKTRGL